MKNLIYILTFIFLVGCETKDKSKSKLNQVKDNLTTNTQAKTDWAFDRVEKSKLLFKNGQSFETNLFELAYIGQVFAESKAPYLIFSGRDCNECDANISIYIHSPSDGKLIIDHGQNRYQYPGTEKDYETDSILYTSRAFYGQGNDGHFNLSCCHTML